MDKVDVVIVGSGINSLVCAAMLVRKGKRISVLERNAVAGGCIRTEQITVPGFRRLISSATTSILSAYSGACTLGQFHLWRPFPARATTVR